MNRPKVGKLYQFIDQNSGLGRWRIRQNSEPTSTSIPGILQTPLADFLHFGDVLAVLAVKEAPPTLPNLSIRVPTFTCQIIVANTGRTGWIDVTTLHGTLKEIKKKKIGV
jgi:hypothetical protein